MKLGPQGELGLCVATRIAPHSSAYGRACGLWIRECPHGPEQSRLVSVMLCLANRLKGRPDPRVVDLLDRRDPILELRVAY